MAVDRWTFFGLFPFSSFFRVFLIGMMYFYIKISVDKRNILPFLIRKVHGFLGSRHVTLCFPPISLSRSFPPSTFFFLFFFSLLLLHSLSYYIPWSVFPEDFCEKVGRESRMSIRDTQEIYDCMV